MVLADETVAEIERQCEIDGRVRLIRGEHGGVAAGPQPRSQRGTG